MIILKKLLIYLLKNTQTLYHGGGENRTIKFGGYGSTAQDVVVFECGVRGPAEWYKIINQRFHPQEYIAHTEALNINEFKEYIKKISEQNKKYK